MTLLWLRQRATRNATAVDVAWAANLGLLAILAPIGARLAAQLTDILVTLIAAVALVILAGITDLVRYDAVFALAALLFMGVYACGDLLEVSDPQRYTSEDLDQSLKAVADGVDGVLTLMWQSTGGCEPPMSFDLSADWTPLVRGAASMYTEASKRNDLPLLKKPYRRDQLYQRVLELLSVRPSNASEGAERAPSEGSE